MTEKVHLKKHTLFGLGCLIGAITFVAIYGVKILDVTYDSWLMAGGDLTQHYIGWKFFRASEWNFPFGLMNGLIYPQKVSIIYMDSIPILAVIFKVFSTLLPTTFQYFGIWGIVSFMLQGGIATLIVRKFTKNSLICIGFSLFFLISPVMIQRMFGHTALAGHWIILLTIYIYLSPIKDLKKNVIIWSGLAGLSVTVHMYFLPMTMVMLICYLLRDYLENKNVSRVFIIFICPILFTLFVMFLMGAFWGKSDLNAFGLGDYSANINALFNPQGFSKYMSDLPKVSKDQVEGLAYLGLGVIIALVVAIYIQIGNLLKIKNRKISVYIKNNLTKFTLFIAIIIFFILALSPRVTLNNNILFTIPYPKIIIKLLTVFRASGRFMWPICYLLVIYVIKIIIDNSTQKQAIIFLGICVIIQISDLSNIIINKHTYFSQSIDHVSKVKSSIWDDLAQQKYKHIVFLESMENMSPENTPLWDLSNYALNNDITLNDGYVARKDLNTINTIKNQYIQELEQGTSREDTIYIIGDNESENLLHSLNYPLSYYNADGIVLGVKKKIPNEKEFNEELLKSVKKGINILPKNNQYLKLGHDEENIRTLNSQGISYGPYIDLEKGTYTVSIIGQNLDNSNYDVCYNQGKNKLEIKEIERNNNKIEFKFNLENNLDGVEFRVFNMNQKDVLLNKILISR